MAIILTKIIQVQKLRYIFLFFFQMKNNSMKINLQILMKKRKYHPKLTSNQNHLTNTPHFRINKKNNQVVTQTQKTNPIFTNLTIILNPEDTPITDMISAHNHKKTIDFSLVKRI